MGEEFGVLGMRAHRKGCGSWACSRCASRLSAKLKERLLRRLEGERIVMVTLTVRRERFGSPRSAYEFFRRNRSVTRAIASFYDANGVYEKRDWFCKLELQSGGWPHYHCLLVVPHDLVLPPKGAFDEHWDYGYSNVLHEADPGYLTKYAAKGENSWERVCLSGLPAVGVHFVSCSRGFWSVEASDPITSLDSSSSSWVGSPGYSLSSSSLEASDQSDEIPDSVAPDDCVDVSFDFGAEEPGLAVRVGSCGIDSEIIVVGCEASIGGVDPGSGRDRFPLRLRVRARVEGVLDALDRLSSIAFIDSRHRGVYWIDAAEIDAFSEGIGLSRKDAENVSIFLRRHCYECQGED